MSEAAISQARRAVAARVPFVFVIFLGSFLLFLIQPMFGRMILPRLGGAPAVWNTAMLFFQAMLLAGYLYAHFVSRWPLKRQLATHLVAFALAAATLPIGLAGFYPDSSAGGVGPALWLIGLLTVSIGPVFFVVSAQAPLMQAWFARSGDPAAHNPYFLYAASNAGSLLALLAYPLAVEPLLPLANQSWLWSGGFAALALTVAGAGLLVSQSGPGASEAAAAAQPHVPASWDQRLRWTALAAIPSGLLLSTTNHITTDVMAMPLLWVIPLALYLLTFIIAFAEGGERVRSLAAAAAPWIVYALGALVLVGANTPVTGFARHLILFFAAALGLHIALARRRPPAEQLTEFYLWMSVGGVIGGIFCALAAPLLFDWTWEHLILIVAAAALLPAPVVPRPIAALWERRGDALRIAFPLAFACLALLAFFGSGGPAIMLLFQLLFLAGFLAVGRPAYRAFCLAMLMCAAGGWANLRVSLDPGARERSFFGVSTILDSADGKRRSLVHGTTVHGIQSLEPGRETEPLAYYARGSGIGAVMQGLPAFAGDRARIGLVGLGAGTLPCFSAPGQSWTAYEIDPVVIRIARDSGQFTFISRCKPGMRIVEGDARLTLAAERPASFDLLVVDAFSSDAIPLHLLTTEAFDVYARTLAERGVIAMNITNRYLDLEPVIAAIAAERGWVGRIRNYRPDAAARARDATESRWLVIAPDEARLGEVLRGAEAKPGEWAPLRRREGIPAWTDDFSSVLPLLLPD